MSGRICFSVVVMTFSCHSRLTEIFWGCKVICLIFFKWEKIHSYVSQVTFYLKRQASHLPKVKLWKQGGLGILSLQKRGGWEGLKPREPLPRKHTHRQCGSASGGSWDSTPEPGDTFPPALERCHTAEQWCPTAEQCKAEEVTPNSEAWVQALALPLTSHEIRVLCPFRKATSLLSLLCVTQHFKMGTELQGWLGQEACPRHLLGLVYKYRRRLPSPSPVLVPECWFLGHWLGLFASRYSPRIL